MKGEFEFEDTTCGQTVETGLAILSIEQEFTRNVPMVVLTYLYH